MSKSLVNWGILGCASIADLEVIPAIKAANNATLYAISSREKKKLEEFRNKYCPNKAYLSYDELLNDPEVDAVYIPLPNSLHCQWTIKAAEKKKHIMCEKPLGVTADEVVKMKEACDINSVMLMEAFAYRHSPLTLTIKSLVEKGTIGKVKFIDSYLSWILNDLSNVRLRKDLSGGCIFDIGCYTINIIRLIAGSEPLSVFATGDIGKESGVVESACIVMEFINQIKAFSYCSFKCAERRGYTIVGETGMIEVPVTFNAEGNISITVRKANNIEEVTIFCPDNYQLEIEQFGRCILEGEHPLVSYEESLGNAQVIDKALDQIYKKSEISPGVHPNG
jgi:predicted dehydrogenase